MLCGRLVHPTAHVNRTPLRVKAIVLVPRARRCMPGMLPSRRELRREPRRGNPLDADLVWRQESQNRCLGPDLLGGLCVCDPLGTELGAPSEPELAARLAVATRRRTSFSLATGGKLDLGCAAF